MGQTGASLPGATGKARPQTLVVVLGAVQGAPRDCSVASGHREAAAVVAAAVHQHGGRRDPQVGGTLEEGAVAGVVAPHVSVQRF